MAGKIEQFNDPNITSPDKVWDGYLDFKSCVESNGPHKYSLRDKDRYLWAKLFKEQLCGDIKNNFGAMTE